MFCRNCGKPVLPDTAFCMSCGARPAAGKSYCNVCGAAVSELAEFCTKCGAKLINTPERKNAAPRPGVSSVYKYAWKMLWPSFWTLFFIGLVVFLISSASGSFSYISTNLSFISSVISIFVGMPLSYGMEYCYLKAAREGEVKFEEVFSGFKHYWNCIGAAILSGLIVGGGLILLIVPGIIFGCKLAFVPFLVMDRNMGPTEAISASWKMTNGHAMEVFAIGLLGFLLFIAGLICLVVGAIVASMWVSTTMASLYYAVSAEYGDSSGQVQPATL